MWLSGVVLQCVGQSLDIHVGLRGWYFFTTHSQYQNNSVMRTTLWWCIVFLRAVYRWRELLWCITNEITLIGASRAASCCDVLWRASWCLVVHLICQPSNMREAKEEVLKKRRRRRWQWFKRKRKRSWEGGKEGGEGGGSGKRATLRCLPWSASITAGAQHSHVANSFLAPSFPPSPGCCVFLTTAALLNNTHRPPYLCVVTVSSRPSELPWSLFGLCLRSLVFLISSVLHFEGLYYLFAYSASVFFFIGFIFI